MNSNNVMNNLEWQGNSKRMYQEILNAVPSLFAGRIKNSIASWIVRNNIQIVTEDVVFQAVSEIAPPNIASKMKSELEKLKSQP